MRHPRDRFIAVCVSACLLVPGMALAQTVRYVDDDASTNGDGTTWGTAYRYLQDALAEASADPGIIEIRVAGGLYTPDQDEGIAVFGIDGTLHRIISEQQ